MAQKYYVVWKGREIGIFTDWVTCKKQVDAFAGAKYKSFPTKLEAENAFRGTTSSRSTSTTAGTRKASGASKRSSPKTFNAKEVANVCAEVKIFTDGGCEPNPGEAGSGLALYRDNSVSELWYGLYSPNGTNNTAELNALHQAILMAKDLLAKDQSVAIFCDSQYAIQCVIQWAEGWQKKGWKRPGGEIKNLNLIKDMFSAYQGIKGKVMIEHVNGHVGVEGNELADRMSILAISSKNKSFKQYTKKIDVAAILSMRTG